MLSEAQGLPLAVAVSGASVHDSQAFKPLILGIPAIRSRRGPRRRKPVKVRGRRTTPQSTSAGSAAGTSSHGSPAPVSSPASGSAGTAGRSSGRSPGSSATAASPSDTNHGQGGR
ncbi:hypothetical protein G3I60_19230 [Streptomyces sp. SID13666]|nr:hypothetical protein [Streptomyces sp. SID13666]NEA71896.1 hypothetical protein [Streptomyces sp. SID13588]